MIPLLLCLSAWAQDPEPAPQPAPEAQAAAEQAEGSDYSALTAELDADLALDKAIVRFQSFIDANPDSEYATAARFLLASLLLEYAESLPPPVDYEAPALLLERVVSDMSAGQAGAFEQEAEAWYLLGWCLREGDPARATEAWSEVLRAAPGSELAISTSLHMGQRAVEEQRYEQAAEHFELARSLGPGTEVYARASYLLGWARYKQRQYAQAISAFVAVLGEGDPGLGELHAEAVQYLAIALAESSQVSERPVSATLDPVLERIPESVHAELLTRTAAALEAMALFGEADAVRARSRPQPTRRRGRSRGSSGE